MRNDEIGEYPPARVLYISYDGIMEPLGYSQVFQYLKHLAVRHRIVLLSYEKPLDLSNRERRTILKNEISSAGIKWSALRYHKRPTSLATLYDLSMGMAASAWLVRKNDIQIVHSRSYVASVIALALKKVFGLRFVFDMRGFWADERVDGGLWPRNSALYRAARWVERQFLTNAAVVVSLTRAGVRVMQGFDYLDGRAPRFAVITTCADLERFRNGHDGTIAAGPDKAPFTLGYVGGSGLWYVFEPAAECFRMLLMSRTDARVMILNRGEHDYIRRCLDRAGVPLSQVEIKAVDYLAVPNEMRKMHAAVYFIKPVFSKISSVPTKLGELLGSGVPCLTNAGIGDVDQILEGEKVGVVVNDFGAESVRQGLTELLKLTEEEGIAERCRNAAVKYFSLEEGVGEYERIYRSLAGG